MENRVDFFKLRMLNGKSSHKKPPLDARQRPGALAAAELDEVDVGELVVVDEVLREERAAVAALARAEAPGHGDRERPRPLDPASLCFVGTRRRRAAQRSAAVASSAGAPSAAPGPV